MGAYVGFCTGHRFLCASRDLGHAFCYEWLETFSSTRTGSLNHDDDEIAQRVEQVGLCCAWVWSSRVYLYADEVGWDKRRGEQRTFLGLRCKRQSCFDGCRAAAVSFAGRCRIPPNLDGLARYDNVTHKLQHRSGWVWNVAADDLPHLLQCWINSPMPAS